MFKNSSFPHHFSKDLCSYSIVTAKILGDLEEEMKSSINISHIQLLFVRGKKLLLEIIRFFLF